MRLKKIIAVFMLTCLVITGIPLSATAETSNNEEQVALITPRLTYIDDAQAALEIDNGVAIVDCWVSGDIFTATKAKVIAELQLKSGNNWIAYATWVDTQNDFEASVYETKSVKIGQTYRVKATVTIWEGSRSEELILFTDETTV